MACGPLVRIFRACLVYSKYMYRKLEQAIVAARV